VTHGPDPAAARALAPRFAALHTPDYRWYFITNLLAMTGDNIEHVISYWVIFQTFHSPTLAGFAVISHWMPFLLFSVYTGALADRYDCRSLIQTGQALFMAASVAWGVLFLTNSLQMWHAVAILLIHGAAGVIGGPAAQLILHDMVGAAQLQSAIRLNASSRNLSILLGPAVGGGLMLLLGPAWGLLVNVLFYVPLTMLLLKLPYTGHVAGAQAPRARFSLGDAFRVLGEISSEPRIVTMILLGGATSFLVGNAFQAQMPEYAHHLGADQAGVRYSLLLAANAAGAVLGALVLESTSTLRLSTRTAILCAGAWGVTMALFAGAPAYGVAVALLLVAGMLNIAFTSMAQTIVQVLAPPRLRGRVVGLFNTAVLGLRAGSGITVGVVGAVINVHWSLALSAVAVVVVSGLLLAREARSQSRALSPTT
jgi:MFS family permease